MTILGIDTSCDETSVAVTDGTAILSNVVSSQVRFHKKYGGVVPFLAQRLHNERIGAVTELALSRAKLGWESVEAIGVTVGPGLAPALQVGLQFAKEQAELRGKPVYAVNHMAGHVASCFAKRTVRLPSIAALISGGHTELVYFKRFGEFKIIGQTLDDALGEAYDKVAVMLGLGYPGGALIAKVAQTGMPDRYNLPVPMRQRPDLDLSYSGLKNAVRLLIDDLRGQFSEGVLPASVIANVAASFEYVAQRALVLKLERALIQYPEAKSLLLAGGVAANTRLRWQTRLLARQRGLEFLTPANLKLCGDNAAMIAIAAQLGIDAGQQPINPEHLDRLPSLKIDEPLPV